MPILDKKCIQTNNNNWINDKTIKLQNQNLNSNINYRYIS